MTTWLPWNPATEPTREECEALMGRRVRVESPNSEAWMTVRVAGIRNIGRIEVLVGFIPDGHAPWLWPTTLRHAPWIVREVEAP